MVLEICEISFWNNIPNRRLSPDKPRLKRKSHRDDFATCPWHKQFEKNVETRNDGEINVTRQSQPPSQFRKFKNSLNSVSDR